MLIKEKSSIKMRQNRESNQRRAGCKTGDRTTDLKGQRYPNPSEFTYWYLLSSCRARAPLTFSELWDEVRFFGNWYTWGRARLHLGRRGVSKPIDVPAGVGGVGGNPGG